MFRKADEELECAKGKTHAWKDGPYGRTCDECCMSYEDRFFDRIGYQETKARVRGTLDNSGYGKDRDAVRGALEALLEWSGAKVEELGELLKP